MTYVYVLGPCYSCGALFSFNPHLVPSVPVLEDGTIARGGTREPICRTCATLANRHRARLGLPLWNVSDEAYEPTEAL